MNWPEFWNRGWYPEKTNQHRRPQDGDLVAIGHAVWRVSNVADVPLDDDDRDQWLKARMPEIESWPLRPFQADIDHVAGAIPSWASTEAVVDTAVVTIRVRTNFMWPVYPKSGRWPQCSCCGEPMPCQAELADRQISASMNGIEKWMSRRPGCCWGCGEPITHRQDAVAYEGDNLDLPGGMPVRFHTRRGAGCWEWANAYELRWLAEDPRRERILTYPKCRGTLYVHADGSSTCSTGRMAFGLETTEQAPDCQGHLTHDHSHFAACYFMDNDWLAPNPAELQSKCPKGCTAGDGHPGTTTSPRPPRRQQTIPGMPINQQ